MNRGTTQNKHYTSPDKMTSNNVCTRIFSQFTQNGLSCGVVTAVGLYLFQSCIERNMYREVDIENEFRNNARGLYDALM